MGADENSLRKCDNYILGKKIFIVRKIAKSDYYLCHVRACLSVCLSVSLYVRMERLDFHWKNFHEI